MRNPLSLAVIATFLVSCSTAVQPSTATEGGLPRMPLAWSLPVPGFGEIGHIGHFVYADSIRGRDSTTVKTVAAVDLQSRQLAWMTDVAPLRASGFRSTFAALGTNTLAVLFQRNGPQRLAVFSSSGQLLHSVDLAGNLDTLGYNGPDVRGDQVVVAGQTDVYALDAASLLTDQPVIRWHKTYDPLYGLRTTVTDDDGNVYVADQRSRVQSFTPAGNLRWEVSTGSLSEPATVSAMRAANGHLYIDAVGKGLQSLDLKTGQLLWNKYTSTDMCPGGGSGNTTNLIVSAGKVMFGSVGGSCIQAFNETDGSLAWAFKSPNDVTFSSEPVEVRGVVYATNGPLWAIDAATGKGLAASDSITDATGGARIVYDQETDQLVQWTGFQIDVFKPIR